MLLKFPFKLISKDNEKIFNKQGRPFLSKKYKDFEKRVRQYAWAQMKGLQPLPGDVNIFIIASFKDKKHCDWGNIPKSVCDALQGIAYNNDKQIKNGYVGVIENADKESFMVGVMEKEVTK